MSWADHMQIRIAVTSHLTDKSNVIEWDEVKVNGHGGGQCKSCIKLGNNRNQKQVGQIYERRRGQV